MASSLIKNKRTTFERIEKFISPLYFTDVNLYGRLYPFRSDLQELNHFAVPNGQRISFKDALTQGAFKSTTVGSSYGPTWSTHWFLVKFQIPEEWFGREVHLRWNAGCEALVWSEEGKPVQGLSGEERSSFPLTHMADSASSQRTLYVEMACNGLCGAGSPHLISPPDRNRHFQLAMAEIAVFDRQVYDLLIDLEVMLDMAKELPDDSPRCYDALYTANHIVNALQTKGTSAYEEASAKSREFFSQRNGQTQHLCVAVGHCHIDTAWLWPIAETVRKCARSWASAMRLMEERPDFVFACSQAQQYALVKMFYPDLYEEVKRFVAKGQFLPVGGTWVEMDGNLPSGESFVRQFLFGQRFFLREFGLVCKEFWLPDTFGYSAQLPQIMRMFGIEHFLTQKLSWNLVNKFPHHNFVWEGIDGSQVLAHFPPADSYTTELKVSEVTRHVRNLLDKGRVGLGMMLFGHGDGGGGPTRAMLDRQLRMADVDGLARVALGRPQEVFQHLESRRASLCRWVGELFLEMHNATYTTQAANKRLNRRCEFALRDAEAVECAAKVCGFSRPTSLSLHSLWEKLLLFQFHDILPGTSIQEVHASSREQLQDVLDSALQMTSECVRICSLPNEGDVLVLNTLAWERLAVVHVSRWNCNAFTRKFGNRHIVTQPGENGEGLLLPVRLDSMCLAPLADFYHPKKRVTLEELDGGSFELANRHLKVRLNSEGHVVSIKVFEGVEGNESQEFVAPGSVCNRLVIFDDVPLYWDAWDVMDYHLETRRPAVTEVLEKLHVVERGPLRVTLACLSQIGDDASRVVQTFVLDALQPYLTVHNCVDWKESHKFLKVEFAFDVRASDASYEIQFGHLRRPTHVNTSWDWAKFEVCGHKWVDLSEHGRGVALLNRDKYGHSVLGNVARLSLLRSPKSPDPTADLGRHKFAYAIMPHGGSLQEAEVVRRAYEFNLPPACFHDLQPSPLLARSWFRVDHPGVVLETLKPAEDGECRYLVRLYEAFGGRCRASLGCPWNVRRVALCDGLENPLQDLSWEGGCVLLDFGPFQVRSLLLLVTDLDDWQKFSWN